MKRHECWKIAIGQIPLVMGDKSRNLTAVFDAIRAAGEQKCDLIVLPECSLTGWLSPRARTQAEPIPGPFTRRLCRAARSHKLGIVIGMEERKDGKLFNAGLLISRDGKILSHCRKIDELDIGLRLYHRGNKLEVIELEGRKAALDVCSDSWKPGIVETLKLMGVEILFSPCAWAIEPGGERRNLAWIARTYHAPTERQFHFIWSRQIQ
jgi:predicted amidohydrolase